MSNHAARRRHAEPEHAPSRPARAPRHPTTSAAARPAPTRDPTAAHPRQQLPFRFDPTRVAAHHDAAATSEPAASARAAPREPATVDPRAATSEPAASAHAAPREPASVAPRVREPGEPRPLQQPRDLAVHTATPALELPPGAVLLSERPVEPERLLRHATSLVRDGGLPLSGRTVQLRGRDVPLVDTPIDDPVARELLDPLALAATGRAPGRPQTRTPGERREALARGRARLLAHLEARRVDRADLPAAFAAFDDACAVQEQILVGLGAAPQVDELGALQGLAPPTLLAASVAQQIDVLLPALDGLTKTVTTLTRTQGPELGGLSRTLVDKLGAGNPLPASFSVFRFSFLSGLVFLRAALAAHKYLIGTVATTSTAGAVQAHTRQIEAIVAGLFLVKAFTHVVCRDSAAAAVTLARYSNVGRNLVWTAAFAQFFSGLTSLTAAALGDERFKRSALFDVGYGAAGALAPLQMAAEKIGERSLASASKETLARFAPGALERELGLEVTETATSRVSERLADLFGGPRVHNKLDPLAKAKRLGRAGAATGYVFAADLAVQMVQLGLKHHEQSSVGLGLARSLEHVERFGGEASALAIALHEASEAAAAPTARTRAQARALHDFMAFNLFALRRRHEDRRGPSTLTHSYPALARRLAAAETPLRRADPDDPASVLLAARELLGALRQLFHEAPKILHEELAALDAARTFFNDTHGPPPP